MARVAALLLQPLLAGLAVAPKALAASACSSDDACAATACGADDAVPATCGAVTCRGRCLCPGATVLRVDGGCDEAVVPDVGGCGPNTTVEVVFAVAMWGGAEYLTSGGPADLASPFGTILRRSVAAAVQASPERVEVTDVHGRSADVTQHIAGSVGIVTFDWAFNFCVAGATAGPQVEPADFEHRFSVKAQAYTAFQQATLRILRIRQPEAETEEVAGGVGGPSVAQPPEAPRPAVERSLLSDYWWIFWILSAALLVAFTAACIILRRRRRRLKEELRQAVEDLDIADLMPGPENSMLRWRAKPGDPEAGDGDEALARASCAFGASEVAADDPFADGCLALAEGDIVEVLASGSVWLYGRVVGEEGRTGFFPERIVQYMGRALRHPAPMSPEVFGNPVDWTPPNSPTAVELLDAEEGRAEGGAAEHSAAAEPAARRSAPGRLVPPPPPSAEEREANGPIVTVTCEFHPDEVQEGHDDLRRHCLTLRGGERVEVLAIGDGWVYARVQGSTPELLGYVPENRVEFGEAGAGAPPSGEPDPESCPELPGSALVD